MSLVNALDFSGKKVLVCGGSDGIGYGVANASVSYTHLTLPTKA